MAEAEKMLVIPKGALFTVTTGEYSDYSIHGVFRAIEEIDADALRAAFLTENPDQDEEYSFECDRFLVWLVRKNLLESIDSFEWHLHDYGNARTEMTVEHEGLFETLDARWPKIQAARALKNTGN